MSDIFRILSRSTSFRTNGNPPQSVTAPSKPSSPSPQQPLTSTHSNRHKKRKRKSDNIDSVEIHSNDARNAITTAVPVELPKELDFFGLGHKKATEAVGGNLKKLGRIGKSDSDDGSGPEGDDGDDNISLCSEARDVEELAMLPTIDEIKSTLRLHRLKFTLLTPPAPTVTPSVELKKTKSPPKDIAKYGPQKKSKKPELVVPPLTDFTQLTSRAHGYALSKRVYANILAQGYSKPTEVQMGALPILMKGDLAIEGVPAGAPVDLLTCAPTGSGKTLAYAVPLLDRLLRDRKERAPKKSIKAVVIAPTKELVGQIVNEVKKLVKGTGITVSQFKKGHRPVSSDDLPPDVNTLPCIKSDIIVSTPLLLKQAIEAAGDGAMTGILGLILDEADVLLDELFREQTLGIWKTLRDRSSGHLRTTLWSATMPSTAESLTTTTIQSTASDYRPHVIRLVVGVKDTSLPTISQSLLYTATEQGKLIALRQYFSTSLRPPILIFMQSIPRVQALFNEILYDLPTPSRIAVLHSDLTDTAREETMKRFRLGEVWILITTDLLSRGMDFRGVRMVINYDIPTSVAAYIHRVGRTGRAGSDGGQAVTYYTKEDIAYVRGIANVISVSGSGVQKWLLDSLPKTSKNDKKMLKRHGVEARHGTDSKYRISTKSGFQRQAEKRKKGAIEASKKRKLTGDRDREGDVATHDDVEEFLGFD
jgi:ATP-dependent RNA helicase DDX52/ROK1